MASSVFNDVAELEASTVLDAHRISRTPLNPLGLIPQVMRKCRFDLLDVLYEAGEFSRPHVAGSCFRQAFLDRSLPALDWLASKDMRPASLRRQGAPAWLGLEDSSGELWEEGFLRLLESGVLRFNDEIARDFQRPQPLLDFALSKGADNVASEVLKRGAQGGLPRLFRAVENGCANSAALIAEGIDTLKIDALLSLHDLLVRQRAGHAVHVASQGAPRDLLRNDTRLKHIVDELAARALGGLDPDASASSLQDYVVSLLRMGDADYVRPIVQRCLQSHRDEMLRLACSLDSVQLVTVLLEEGASTDPSMGGRRPVSIPDGYTDRNFSPVALHNARSVPVMRALLDYGADLHAVWSGKGVLHWMIDKFRHKNGYLYPEIVDQGREVFDFLDNLGVDFSEGANGRSIQQLAAKMDPELKRHLVSIRMGSSIASAMGHRVSSVAMESAGCIL